VHAYICICRQIYTYVSRSLLLARCTFFPLHSEFDKFICLCGAIRPHLAVVAVGKSTKRKRATKGPPMTVSFQRKRNCGGPAAESSTRCIYRSKIGIKRERATRRREGRGFVQSSDETKTVGMKNTDFYSGRLYWVAPLWPVPQLGPPRADIARRR